MVEQGSCIITCQTPSHAFASSQLLSFALRDREGIFDSGERLYTQYFQEAFRQQGLKSVPTFTMTTTISSAENTTISSAPRELVQVPADLLNSLLASMEELRNDVHRLRDQNSTLASELRRVDESSGEACRRFTIFPAEVRSAHTHAKVFKGKHVLIRYNRYEG